MAYTKYHRYHRQYRQYQQNWLQLCVRERGKYLHFDGAGAPLVHDWIDRNIYSRFKISTFIIWNVASFIAGLITFAIWVS